MKQIEEFFKEFEIASFLAKRLELQGFALEKIANSFNLCFDSQKFISSGRNLKYLHSCYSVKVFSRIKRFRRWIVLLFIFYLSSGVLNLLFQLLIFCRLNVKLEISEIFSCCSATCCRKSHKKSSSLCF